MTPGDGEPAAVARAVLLMRDYVLHRSGGDRGDPSMPAAWTPTTGTPTFRRVLEDNRLLNLWSPEDRAGLDDHREAVWSMNAPALYTIAELSRRLAADAIPHVFIKSPLLTRDLYGDPFFRMSTDVDVLIAAADRAATLRVLAGLDFQLSAACRTLYWRTFMGEQHLDPTRPDFLTVDLHTTIRHPAGYAPDLTRRILAGRTTAALGDGSVPVPNPSDAVLLAAIYLLKALLKYEPAGSHLLDLAVMYRRLDAAAARSVTALAAARGLRRTTAFARDTVTALLEPGRGAASPEAAPLRRALGGGDPWMRLLAPAACQPLPRARCVAASCDGGSDRLRALGWEIGRKLAQQAAHAGLF